MEEQTTRREEEQPKDAVALLEAARREAAEKQDKYLRALAESENMRKRMDRLCEERVWQERKRVLSHLLDLADQVERALQFASADDPIGEGVRVILQHVRQVLAQEGIAEVATVGQPFDPNLHEAMETVDTEGEPDEVTAEFRKGYTLSGRLLRAARVQVRKAS